MRSFRPAAYLTLTLLLSSCAPVIAGGVVAGTGVSLAREKTFGRAADDYTIATKIRAEFLNADAKGLFEDVGIEVDEGRVLLTGQVSRDDIKARAVDLVWKVPGVKELINEIRISASAGMKSLPTDSWVTTEIRSKIFFDKTIKGVNYSVETVAGTVYLFGVAQDQVELDKVVHIARTTKYVKEVISHVVLKSDPRRKL